MSRVGIISDTHGLLRPEAIRALGKVDRIIHAGDVGDPKLLEELRALAPVTAVRGNTDRGPWASDLPETTVLEIDDALLYVIHDLSELDLDPAAAGFHAVVYGHSHIPEVREVDGVPYVNPGSAGPVRFSRPVSLALASVTGTKVEARILKLL